jgi:uncharacterized protein YjbJ (UPF0337 family)
MADYDDRPDDSKAHRHAPGSVREEMSATGQRVKGAMKKAAGKVTDDERLEEKGKREMRAGRSRSRRNNAL